MLAGQSVTWLMLSETDTKDWIRRIKRTKKVKDPIFHGHITYGKIILFYGIGFHVF